MPKSRRKSDNLRDMETPRVLGYDLDRKTLTPIRREIDTTTPGDYGADPVGDGTFKMVPSGDIVTLEERNRRLRRFIKPKVPRHTSIDLDQVMRRMWNQVLTLEQRLAVATDAYGQAGSELLDLRHAQMELGVGPEDFRGISFDDFSKGMSAEEHDRFREALMLHTRKHMDRVEESGGVGILKAVNDIAATQSPRYGPHTELAEVQSTLLSWSNGAETWFVYDRIREPGEEVELDANEILVPFPPDQVTPIVPFLDNHWAYRFSLEGRGRRGTAMDDATTLDFYERWARWFDLGGRQRGDVRPRIRGKVAYLGRSGPGRGWHHEHKRHVEAGRRGAQRRRT